MSYNTTTAGNVRHIAPGDAEWPTAVLATVPEGLRPTELWVMGPLRLNEITEELPVALVGTNAPSAYGTQVAADLATGLSRKDVPLISGSNYGISHAVHLAAQRVNAPTVAVLSSGMDRPHPAGNCATLRRIAETGLLVTAFADGTASSRHTVLARSRLIAALAAATVVVESGVRSGSLATAAFARRFSRPVGAVPGPVTSATSTGCNALLRDGARVIVDATDACDLRFGPG